MRSTMGIGIAAVMALMVSLLVPGTNDQAQMAIGNDPQPGTRPAYTEASTVATLMDEAITLRHDHRYTEALEVLNKVLARDADHTRARWMADDLTFVLSAVHGLKNPEEDAATAQVRDQLNQTLSSIQFPEGTIFSEALEYLRESTGLNIVVNWVELEISGIERDAKVSMNLKDTKLSKVLDLVLQAVGAGEFELGYFVDEGVVIISTRKYLDRRTITRVYDIRDLLTSELDHGRKATLERLFRGVAAGMPGGSTDRIEQEWNSLVKEIVAMLKRQSGEEVAMMIQQTIFTNIRPGNGGSPRPGNGGPGGPGIGGPGGTAFYIDGQLVVRHTHQVHEEIVELLHRLRLSR